MSALRNAGYEVTVGRFRAFLQALPGSRPKAGDGAHPLIQGSGWDPTWPLVSSAGEFAATIDAFNRPPSSCRPPGVSIVQVG
jgi:hypothetical protein